MTQVLQSPGITLQNKAHTVIPQIGFGTFQIPPEDTQRSVEEALEIGYRHIDTAAAYYNEEQVGDALRATGMANKVWVTTKLRNCDQGYDPARIAFEESRRKLGVDVVDMYLDSLAIPRSRSLQGDMEGAAQTARGRRYPRGWRQQLPSRASSGCYR